MPENSSATVPALILDAASPQTWVGLAVRQGAETARWVSSDTESGVALFELATQLLRESELDLAAVRKFVFCDGPGSMLGIRLAAMALRTWSALNGEARAEVYSYRSLDLFAASLLADSEAPPFVVLADARRKSWNVLKVDPGGMFSDVERVATESLGAVLRSGVPCFAPKQFPAWQAYPAGTQLRDYSPRRLFDLLASGRLSLRRCEEPDAWFSDAPTYKKWDPSQRPAPPVPRRR